MNKKTVKVAKPHRVLLQAIVSTLETIFNEHKYADKVIEKTLKENPKFGSRDRRLVAETTYDIVRNYRLLAYLSQRENDFWSILGVYFIVRQMPVPHEREFKEFRQETVFAMLKAISDEKIKQSYPDWLWLLCEKELGKTNWLKEAKALNQQAEVVLRVNTHKSRKEILQKFLIEKYFQID